MTNEELLTHIRFRLTGARGVRALFLGGGFGRGVGDEYSDLDFIAVVDEPDIDDFLAEWRKVLTTFEPIVYWAEHKRGGKLVNAITQSWVRCDLHIPASGVVKQYTQDGVIPLIDPMGIYDELKPTTEQPPFNAKSFRRLIDEFLRVLGLTAVVVGREEFTFAIWGAAYVRNLVIDLMLLENRPAHRGGALHLNDLLTTTQRMALDKVPPVEPNRNSIITANLAYADLFLPRARALAVEHDVEWPVAFEAATWAYLERELSIEIGLRPARARRRAVW